MDSRRSPGQRRRRSADRASWWGIDFSGSVAQWRRRRTSNVWIAELRGPSRRPRVASLAPVQALPGDGEPFLRLAALLATAPFEACGIDAPLSVPAALLGERSHRELVALVARLAGEPFPHGAAFVATVAGRSAPLSPAKPLRACERLWRSRGVNVRSTMWCGPRGGAAFTAACLTLAARARRPVWPFDGATRGCLVESFPAAQLRHWRLPHQRYDGTAGAAVRREIVDALRARVSFGTFRAQALASADALDAVLAAFGAIAAREDRLAEPVAPDAGPEGWIAVHR